MRENRLSGSEGGATLITSSLPLSFMSPSGTKSRRAITIKLAPMRRSLGLPDSLFQG